MLTMLKKNSGLQPANCRFSTKKATPSGLPYNTGKKKWACGATNLPIGATAASQVAEQEIVAALIN